MTGVARFMERCANCQRPLNVEGRDAPVRDRDGVMYCSKNCSWSVIVDPGGARLRAARRAKSGKAVRKRKKRVPIDLDGDVDDEQKQQHLQRQRQMEQKVLAMEKKVAGYRESHAVLEFHELVFGGLAGGDKMIGQGRAPGRKARG